MMQATSKPSPVRPVGTTGRKRNMLPIHIVLTLGAITMIFPFYWMVITSFKTIGESLLIPPTMLPSSWALTQYHEVLRTLPMGKLYFNTMLLIVLRIACATLFSSMAAFAFAKLSFPLKGPLFFIVITQMMLPPQVFIIPQYLQLSKINMLNSHFALLYPGLVSAFGTFFLRQFYLSLPGDLSEAAMIDGCNVGQTFVKILLPLTKTALMALAVFTAVFAYGEMMWPLVVNMKVDMMTLSAGISSLQGQHITKYPLLMAGSAMAMIPMLVLYLFFQKQFIEGIALTGTKA